MSSNGWVGVDLDGTLAESYWPHKGAYDPLRIGDPIPLMVGRVKNMLAEGMEVRIFTARVGPHGSAPDFPHDREELEAIHQAIRDWTKLHIGQKLEATCVKDYGMKALYEDRAVRIVHNTGRTCCSEPSIFDHIVMHREVRKELAALCLVAFSEETNGKPVVSAERVTRRAWDVGREGAGRGDGGSVSAFKTDADDHKWQVKLREAIKDAFAISKRYIAVCTNDTVVTRCGPFESAETALFEARQAFDGQITVEEMFDWMVFNKRMNQFHTAHAVHLEYRRALAEGEAII